jgi:glycosyltransferase involved in cell wall biosynthesis
MPPRTVALHAGQLLQPVPGGIGRYVRSLLGALPGAGVAPVAFAAGPRPDDLDAAWVDLGRPRAPTRYELWHRLRRPLVRAPGEVLHATSLAVPPAGGRPLVVTVHDLVFLRQPEHLTPRGVSFHRRGLDLARRDAAVVVVPTAWGRDDLLGEGFAADRVHVAHHGVEVGPDPGPEATQEVLGRLGVRAPFVLFASTIEPRKGAVDLVLAHEAVRAARPDLDLQLVMAGPAGWGEPPDLDRPGVVVLGKVGDPELEVLYRHALALAHPARYEGFGMQVAEAMARGCPVVTTDAACLPEVAGGAADLVPVGDVEALGAALLRLVEDEGHRAARSATGAARAAAFTWEASAQAHAGAYAAAAEGAGAAGRRV